MIALETLSYGLFAGGSIIFVLSSMRTIAVVGATGDLAARRKEILFNRLIAFLLIVVALWEFVSSPLEHSLPSLIGGIGMLFSAMLYKRSTAALSDSFSPVEQLRSEHVLCTSGPFSRTRNPIYLSYAGATISVFIATLSLVFLTLALVHLARLFWRIPTEEQNLRNLFGEEFEEYCRNTPRFL